MNDTPITQADLAELDLILDRTIPIVGRRITDTWTHWLEAGRPDLGNWQPDRKRIVEIARTRERSKL